MRAVLAALVAGSLFALSGCSGVGNEIKPEQASTEGVVAALVLSPQHVRVAEGHGGYVVLVYADGSTQSLPTSGMDMAEIHWDEDGIFYSDSEHDYWLAGKLTSVSSPKTIMQKAAYRDPTTGAYVGLYNQGFSGDGRYTEEVVVSTKDGSTNTEVEGAYRINAQCDDRMFGIAPRSGKYLKSSDRAATENGRTPDGVMLAQLYPLVDGHERVVGTVNSPPEGPSFGSAPCQNGILRYVAGLDKPDGKAVIRSWNIETGEMTETDIRDADGNIRTFARDEIGSSTYLPDLSHDDVVWLSANGVLQRTDPTTGRTDKLATLPTDPNSRLNVKTDSAGNIVIVEEPIEPVQGSEVRLRVFDSKTGAEISALTIPGLRAHLSPDLALRDFAVRPPNYTE